MMRSSSLAAASLALCLAAIGGCGGGETGTSSTGSAGSAGSGTGTGGSGGSDKPPPPPYQPAGCAFEIGARPEYMDWQVDRTETGATPNIRRVRVGLGGNITPGPGKADPATSVGVAWQTDDGTLASHLSWGTTPDPASWPEENRASGVTWLTPQGLINGTGDERMHEVHVCGLTPSTTYYYRAGGGPPGQEQWSAVYSFTTAPANADTPVTIAFNGDARGQAADTWRLYQKKLPALGVNLQLFSGDTVWLATDQGEWEKWLDLAWKDEDDALLTLGQLLTLTTNGNHDNRSTLFFGNMVLPQESKKFGPHAELFYSVDYGPVHVAVIDDSFFVNTVIAEEDRKAAADWLSADLAAADANRAAVPWIVTMHHHGPFSSSNHGTDADVLRGRDFFVPLFDEHHVDLDVAGHDHNYERTRPLTGPAATPTLFDSNKDGTVYVLCAGAGAPAYSSGTSPFTALSRDYVSSGALGVYGLLKATKTEMTLEAYEIRPDGTDPQFDSFVFTK